jgi:DNA excision repair protein ERCC-2
MVFAPSYEALARLKPYVPGAILEEPGLSQDELMARVARFKAARSATFACVLGGRVAEGLDFPDEELQVAVVVGLPYPKPTARQRALERYYDHVAGRGFEIASKAPMLRRTLQAAGRVVRTPTDRGVVAILDKRAVLLADELGGVRVERDCAAAVAEFFRANV